MTDFSADERTLLAHELRSPLGAILAYTELLLDEPGMTPQRSEHLLVVRNNTDWLIKLVSRMLSRSGAEDPALQEPSDPVRMVQEHVRLFTPAARNRGLHLFLDNNIHGLALNLDDHELLFRQIISNLLGNALKFTIHGGVRVALSAASLAEGRAMLHVAVSDTGIGMDEAQIAAVGRPYVQVHPESRQRGGLGLGLATCRSLSERLGGSLQIRSASGRGSTFTVSIPVAATAADEAAVIPAPAGLPTGRYLLADDDGSARLLAAVLFKRAGARVTLVEHGAAALIVTRSAEEAGRPFDVIVLDVHMPQSGPSLVGELRSLGFRGRIIGASADAGARDACLAAGMDGFIAKPLSLEALQTSAILSVPL